jgi:hypothetical protein
MEAPMKAVRFALGLFLFLALLASASMAQAQRTFVSGLGNDANPCSRTAPCRNFAQAISQTNPGGEVVALDSAGYGLLVITKAVTVQAPPGVYAATPGVTIAAGTRDVVVLRGLAVVNSGPQMDGDGIVYYSGYVTHIESCVVAGFNTNNAGIFLYGGGGSFFIKDCTVRGNFNGIWFRPGGGQTQVGVIERVRLEDNGTNGGIGLLLWEGARVSIRDSVISRTYFGLAANANSGTSELTLENCLVSNNQVGILGGGSAGTSTVRVSNSTVIDNLVGLSVGGPNGGIITRGNNTVEGNTTKDVDGTLGTYTAK